MRKAIGLALVVLAVGMAPGRSVLADVSPGDKINASERRQGEGPDLAGPASGASSTASRSRSPRRSASSGRRRTRRPPRSTRRQVKLSADGSTVQNYVAGQPFPNIDPKDPQVAIKIMWNYDYGFVNGLDDIDLRNFDADTGSIPHDGPMTVERHFLLDHFRRLFWNAPALRRSEAGEAEPQRLSRAAGPLSDPRAVRPEGRRRARQPLHRLRASRTTPGSTCRRSAACAGSRRRSARTRSSARTPTSTATTATPARSPGWTGSTSARRRCSAPSTPSTSR